MDLAHIISVIAYSLIAILILINFIEIKKPYNYLTVVFIILPAIIVQTPIVKDMSRSLELIFGTLYFLTAMGIIISYGFSMKKKK